MVVLEREAGVVKDTVDIFRKVGFSIIVFPLESVCACEHIVCEPLVTLRKSLLGRMEKTRVL